MNLRLGLHCLRLVTLALLVNAGALSDARAALILTNVDARVSTTGYTVTSSTGVVPAIALSVEDHTDHSARLSLQGGAFSTPYRLDGRVRTDEWELIFAIIGSLNVFNSPQFLEVQFQAQHLSAPFAGQSGPGSVLRFTRELRTGPGQGFVAGLPYLADADSYAYVSAGHGGRGDVLFGQLIGNQDLSFTNVTYWQLEATVHDVPEPASLSLLGLGLIPVARQYWISRDRKAN